MSADAASMADDVRQVLFPETASGAFDPIACWEDFGRMIEALESRGCFLMTNTVSDPKVRRMASFHKSTEQGYPCVGASEWGPFARLGEAVLMAAHEALLEPRA
ncbi:MAG: hypothetical protein VX913_00220 [Planctomycetota bacterium]|nr:hypothetical protein [Planctomycetota bacterium]